MAGVGSEQVNRVYSFIFILFLFFFAEGQSVAN